MERLFAAAPAVITIDIDPMIEIGPLTLTWHGVGIAVGIAVGTLVASRYGVRRGLDAGRIQEIVLVVSLAGIVGARLLFLLEKAPGDLLRPAEWFGGRGFSFYGGMIFGTVAAALWARRHGLGARHLDALAAGFPLGMAVGRVGDLINGEHYGPPTSLPWGIRYTHPEADVPSGAVAYHPGGLYEIVLAFALLAVLWALHRRLRAPGALLWTVVGLYAAGRFFMFFYRVDSDDLALGLDSSQWVSVLLVAAAAVGLVAAARPGSLAGVRARLRPRLSRPGA